MKSHKDPFKEERLFDIRRKLEIQSQIHNTESWNDRFLLNVIDDLKREIRKLKTQIGKKI